MVRPERQESLRDKVYNFWVENPLITAKGICKKLAKKPLEAKKFYKQHGNYINKLLSQFRSYHKFGSPQKPQNVPHRRVFVWECVPRRLLLDFLGADKFFGGLGWATVANRNGMLVFRDDFGTIHWYKGGKVVLYLRGELQLARAKELFCRGFNWFTSEQFCEFLDVPLREESKHWVFDVGVPMPRFDVRQFERSHGLRIFTDGSHPTSLEVIETEPFWMGEFRGVTRQFGKEITEHLSLIKIWQEQATTRLDLGGITKAIRNGLKPTVKRLQRTLEAQEREEKLLWALGKKLTRKKRKPKPKKPTRLQRLRRRLPF